MDELRPGCGSGQRDRLRTRGLHRAESLLAALEQDTDQIDDDVGAPCRGLDRFRIAHVSLYRMNLADAPQRLQMPGKMRPANRNAKPAAAFGERPHHMAAEETRAAENGGQRIDWNGRHASALCELSQRPTRWLPANSASVPRCIGPLAAN